MSSRRPPFARATLWGLLAACLLAVAVGALFGRRWAGLEGEAPAPLGALPAFRLTGSDGRTVSLGDLAGRPWVADLIFTRCGGTCPRLTSAMRRLGPELAPRVRRVSISVDPAHDTPEVLARYAATFGITDPDWLFLTGPREEVLRLCREGFRLAVDDAPAPGTTSAEEPILHSTRFVLVDARGRVRGYYDGLSEEGLRALVQDAWAVGRERG